MTMVDSPNNSAIVAYLNIKITTDLPKWKPRCPPGHGNQGGCPNEDKIDPLNDDGEPHPTM